MKTIEQIRGDTINLVFPLKDENDNIITLDQIDTLVLTSRKYPNKNSPILFNKNKEDFILDDDGQYNVTISPTDTETLTDNEVYFDIEVTLKNGIRKSKIVKIILEKDYTIHGGIDNGN